jgi:hypothetical protein
MTGATPSEEVWPGTTLRPGWLIATRDYSALDLDLSPVPGSDSNAGSPFCTLRIYSYSALRVRNTDGKEVPSDHFAELDLLKVTQFLGIVPATSECNTRLVQGQSSLELIFRRSAYRGAQQSVYLFRTTGELILLSGTVTVNVTNRAPVLVSAGQTLNTTAWRVTELASDAPERKLWP